MNRRSTSLRVMVIGLITMLCVACSAGSSTPPPSTAPTTTAPPQTATAAASTEPTSSATESPASSPDRQTISVTDMAGRQMEIVIPVERILALHPIPSYIVWRLAGERMVSKDSVFEGRYLGEDSTQVFTTEETARLASLPTTGTYFRGFDPEQILSLNPDVVISMTKDPALDEETSQTNIPFYAVSKDKLTDYEQMILQIGEILDNKSLADELAAFWVATIASVTDETSQIPENERPRVYYANSGILRTPGPETVMASIIDLAGGENVAVDLGDNPTNEGTEVTIEQVLAWDPEVVITTTDAERQQILEDPLWAGVAAVNEGRVYAQRKYAITDGITAAMGLMWTYGVLHHDGDAEFEERFSSRLREFYELFHDYQIADDQIAMVQ